MAAASPAHIGVDFDNTIVAYDSLFHRIAREQGLIPPDLPVSKSGVRNYLRACGQEPAWTALQGLVYGPRITEAEPFAGVFDFFASCARAGVPVSIISHKTKTPILGEPHNLHAAATRWLDRWGFLGLGCRDRVFLEMTKFAKLRRIRTSGCTHFIDDLPELLSAPEFSESVQRILFDPTRTSTPEPGMIVADSWEGIREMFIP